jgi:large subunit ribosomal protein L25
MEKLELAAAKRSVRGRKNAQLRAEGKVPAVVYGHGVKSEPLELEARELERIFHLAGGNKIVALKVDEGRARNVLFHDVQREAKKGGLLHVDFYVVKMNELLQAEVPLRFVGESTAVYRDEGTLTHALDAVVIECLPGDLPDTIEVDITGLDDFEKVITLADLKLPDKVKFVEENLDTVVARVEAPRSQEELEELDEEPGDAVPEGATEGDEQAAVSESNEGDKDQQGKGE